MKIIAEYTSRMDAEIAKGFLASAGIMAHVSADDGGGLHPELASQKGAQLLVPDELEEKAREILAKVEKDESQ